MKRALFLLLVLICHQSFILAQTMDEEIDRLMSKMTLDEKIGQLNLVTSISRTGPFATKKVWKKMEDGQVGGVFSIFGKPEGIRKRLGLADSTRLKIPFLNGLDIIHGYETIFPIPLGMACSWDMDLIERAARVAAIEGTAAGYNWVFSPMVDITRDPRWGRVMEGAGEDPVLGSAIAKAMVHGYQGDDLSDPTSMMACVKHFACYGLPEAGREYNTTDISRLQMYQLYLPPYKAAIDAGVGSVMSSFNDVDGVPAAANRWLLTDLLRDQWGFKGVVATDYAAVQELIQHGVAVNYEQSAKLAMNAGVDMDMVSECFLASLKTLLDKGEVTMQQVDTACRRVLEAKGKLGMFKNPYRSFDASRAKQVMCCPAHLAVAREAARKSLVLVKNENHVLPLKKDAKIALIGPFGNNRKEMFSMWVFKGDTTHVTTMYDGLREVDPNVSYALGTQITDEPDFCRISNTPFDQALQQRLIQDAKRVAEQSDVVVLSLGEIYTMSGECKSKTDLSLPPCQKQLLRELRALGKPIVLVLQCGRPMTIGEDLEYVDAAFIGWRLGSETGHALADILFGDYTPSGKLTMTFPRNVGQIPIHYMQKNTGRPYDPLKHTNLTAFASMYIDEPNAPLFPFGYGLSYNHYEYGDPYLSSPVISADGTCTVSFDVTNKGQFEGDEIVQLYIHDKVASVARSMKELKDFARITLKPGETKTVTFEITPETLKFYNQQLQYVIEPGEFDIMVGPSSDNLKTTTLLVQ